MGWICIQRRTHERSSASFELPPLEGGPGRLIGRDEELEAVVRGHLSVAVAEVLGIRRIEGDTGAIGLGLALVLAIYRRKRTVELEAMQELKG